MEECWRTRWLSFLRCPKSGTYPPSTHSRAEGLSALSCYSDLGGNFFNPLLILTIDDAVVWNPHRTVVTVEVLHDKSNIVHRFVDEVVLDGVFWPAQRHVDSVPP